MKNHYVEKNIKLKNLGSFRKPHKIFVIFVTDFGLKKLILAHCFTPEITYIDPITSASTLFQAYQADGRWRWWNLLGNFPFMCSNINLREESAHLKKLSSKCKETSVNIFISSEVTSSILQWALKVQIIEPCTNSNENEQCIPVERRLNQKDWISGHVCTNI